MFNTKIGLSLLSILTASAMLSGATFAFFSDSATSSNNTFASGTLNLQLDDVNHVTPVESVSGSIGGTNMFPGSSPITGYISVHNAGNTPMSKVIFGANQTAGVETFNLADVLNITVKTDPTDPTCAAGTDQTGAIATALGDHLSPLTMTELVNTDYDALPGLSANGTYNVCVSASLPSSVTNDYQGKTATFDFVFNGQQ